MSTSGGKKKNPQQTGDANDTIPVDPVELQDNDVSQLDAGWDLDPDEFLSPDEGPTVVDGNLELAAEAGEQGATREPAKTFLGLGPEDSLPLAPEQEVTEEEITGDEVTEVAAPALPDSPSPGPSSALANLAAQDVAFKDTLPGSLDQLATEVPAEALEPEPVVIPEPKAVAPIQRPTPPMTAPALVRPGKPLNRQRPQAETEPSEPVGPGNPGASSDDVALAATIAPGTQEAMSRAPTLAPDAGSGLKTLDAPALPSSPAPPAAAPTPAAPAPTPAAELPAPSPHLEEPTQTVEPMRSQPPAQPRAPSNLTLTILWVLALISVIVALALYLLRPTI